MSFIQYMCKTVRLYSERFVPKCILHSFACSIQGVVAGEVDEQALMPRKSRTQVFSGRKLPTTVAC